MTERRDVSVGGEAAARVPDGRLVVIPVGHQVHATRPAEFAAAALDVLLA